MINMNILQGKKYCLLIKVIKIKEQAKFAYFPLGKAFEKQAEKRVGAMNGLKLLNCKISLKKMF